MKLLAAILFVGLLIVDGIGVLGEELEVDYEEFQSKLYLYKSEQEQSYKGQESTGGRCNWSRNDRRWVLSYLGEGELAQGGRDSVVGVSQGNYCEVNQIPARGLCQRCQLP